MLTTIRVDQPFPIIRATVPLDGSIRWTPESCPFVMRDGTGRALTTQWELVVGGQQDWRDVRVAEVFAIAPPNAPLHATYTLELASPAPRDTAIHPGPWARKLAATGGLAILVDGSPEVFSPAGRFRSGPCATTLEFVSAHAFCWVTVFDGLDVAWLDLVVHNGRPGQPDWFFDQLALATSSSMGFASSWPEPQIVNSADGSQLILVPARTDGKLHGLEQRGWRIFQGALHDRSPAAVLVAQAMAGGAGFGVADSWTKVDAYQPQAMRLPNLAYRANELRSTLRTGWAQISAALASGAPFGMGTTEGGRLDWRHPWGHKYGGITGGGYRYQWHGVEVASCGEFAGVLELRARLRMIADRSPIAIIGDDGGPELLEDWLTATGAPRGGWRMRSDTALFHSDGAFGWSAAPPMVSPAQIPAEFTELQTYTPIDFQHADRSQKPAESLVYLVNDPIARWWVNMTAELWRMSRFTDGRMQGDWTSSRAKPGVGVSVGRADGHGWSNAAAANAFARTPHRQRWSSWFTKFVETLLAAQMPNGLYRRDFANKEAKTAPFGNGTRANWAITKGTEEALLAFALTGVSRSCELPGALEQLAEESVDRWSIDGIWKFLAEPAGAPTKWSDYVGVVPVTWHQDANGYWVPTLGVPTSDAVAAVRVGGDRTELMSPVGCAMLLRKKRAAALAPEQSAAAKQWAANAPDVLAWMKKQSLYNLQLDDCAPLHAALEFP